MTPTSRNYVVVTGNGPECLVLSQGFGVDHRVWCRVLPFLERRYTVIRYDLTGLGNSQTVAYDPVRHATLHGHADDLLEICTALRVKGAFFVGHSVGGMIGALASIRAPELFQKVVFIAASPHYIDEPGYRGGFTREQVEQVCQAVARDYIGWCSEIVPVAVGGAQAPEEVRDHVLRSFHSVDPTIAHHMARMIFFSDHREDMLRLLVKTLVIQPSRDVFVPIEVGKYIARQVPNAELFTLNAPGGHYPHLGAPDALARSVVNFLSGASTDASS